MGWTHGQNARGNVAKKSWDKQTNKVNESQGDHNQRKVEEDEEWEKDRRQRAMEVNNSPVGVERCDRFV